MFIYAQRWLVELKEITNVSIKRVEYQILDLETGKINIGTSSSKVDRVKC